MYKIHKRNSTLVAIVIFFICAICLFMLLGSTSAKSYAETTITDELISKLENMTDDLKIEVNNQINDIINYGSYLFNRFQLNNKQYDVRNITDDRILNLVPLEVFNLRQEFLYIGKAYGFYLDFNKNNDTYLVYLMKNTIKFTEGLLTRSIELLYYEQYVLNEESNTISLVYWDYYVCPNPEQMSTYREHYYHYKKLADYERLYLKDVNFTGSLYNENHSNIDEQNYDPYQDNGGYFVGSHYIYKEYPLNMGSLILLTQY